MKSFAVKGFVNCKYLKIIFHKVMNGNKKG